MSRVWNLITGWEEVLVTPDINQYMNQKAKLSEMGIATRSEFSNNPAGAGGIGSPAQVGMYYLFVKREKQK